MPSHRRHGQRLAAAYGFALARGHGFPDGNERVALAVIDVFLRMNGLELTAKEADAADNDPGALRRQTHRRGPDRLDHGQLECRPHPVRTIVPGSHFTSTPHSFAAA